MTDNSGGSSNRYSGILTESDVEYLSSLEWDDQDSLDRNTRYRIRQRIIRSIVDLAYLSQTLHDEDRKLIFEELFDNPDLIERAMSFFYLGALDQLEISNESARWKEELGEKDETEYFADIVSEAIQSGNQERGILSSSEVSIETDRREYDPDELIEALLDPENKATMGKINYLIQQGYQEEFLEKVIELEKILTIETPREVIEITPNAARRILRELEDT